MIPGLQHGIYQIKVEMILQGVNLSNIDKLHAHKVEQNSDSEDDSDEEGITPGGKPKSKPGHYQTHSGKRNA